MDIWVREPYQTRLTQFSLSEQDVSNHFADNYPDTIYFFAELYQTTEPVDDVTVDALIACARNTGYSKGMRLEFALRAIDFLENPIPRLPENPGRVLTSSQIWVLEPESYGGGKPRLFTGNEAGACSRATQFPDWIFFFEEVS